MSDQTAQFPCQNLKFAGQMSPMTGANYNLQPWVGFRKPDIRLLSHSGYRVRYRKSSHNLLFEGLTKQGHCRLLQSRG